MQKILLVSTWHVKCGIATYTEYLLNSLRKVSNSDLGFDVLPVNDISSLSQTMSAGIVHLQHEFGIFPKIPEIDGKIIVTWHSIPFSGISLNNNMNVDAHIVHTQEAKECLEKCTSKPVYVIKHGSFLYPNIDKSEARKLLDLNENIKIGFIFGFQSRNKKYIETIEAAKDLNLHLLISGATHRSSYRVKDNLKMRKVIFLDRYLSELEVSLYALASDIFIFNYISTPFYSSSGAMHRLIGAGKPVICSDVAHFSELEDGKNCLKFKNKEELKACLKQVLNDEELSEKLGRAALEYAEETSWDKVAREHVKLYEEIINAA
jgi:glycosyltransferase involved in cell wall biosynthesis